MQRSTLVGAVAGFAGALVIGTVAVANAGTTPTPSQSSQSGESPHGDGPHGGDGHGGPQGHPAVTGGELTKIKAAVAAKAPGVTVTQAYQDADGSYDAFGTKGGSRVMVEVSKDLTTVEVSAGGPDGHGGRGDRGPGMGGMGTEVDAATLARLKAAVSAKDPGVTIERATKMPDGDYGALGTKAGQHVMVHVSADLKSVDVRTGHGHHARGERPGSGGTQAPTTVPTPDATGASYSA